MASGVTALADVAVADKQYFYLILCNVILKVYYDQHLIFHFNYSPNLSAYFASKPVLSLNIAET